MRLSKCLKECKTRYFDINKDIESILVFGNIESQKCDLSIVIPTYKRVDLLKKCVNSIIRQKGIPDELDYEVSIVSNDPSFSYKDLDIDLDPDIFRIYINRENIGMCGNMNRCAVIAKGRYVAYIQDDDVLLPQYIMTVGTMIKNNKLNGIDCIIPNRYYYMPNKDRDSQFGKKSMRNISAKRVISKILRFGRPVKKLEQLSTYDTLVTTYPFYSGGPTCGILFDHNSLLNSGGFNPLYPYGFDYMFFMDFNKDNKVFLYDDFLALYMTANSASNRPEVQYDFFRARYDFLNYNYRDYNISDYRKQTLEYLTYLGYQSETKRMIDDEYSIKKIFKLRIYIYKIMAMLKTYRSGGYRRKVCPQDIINWYELL